MFDNYNYDVLLRYMMINMVDFYIVACAPYFDMFNKEGPVLIILFTKSSFKICMDWPN